MSVLKLRGLPWSCTTDDIIKFMDGVQICINPQEGDKSKLAIYMMTNSDGRPSGEAFIKVESETDVDIACDKNNALMGQRYIEVFRSNEDQLNKHLNESTNNSQNWRDPIVRLRGLPYGCEKKDILVFFSGLSTSDEDIMMVIDFSGRFNGEAFVQFGNLCDALKALEKHKQKISNRYIEVFRSTFIEMDHYQNGGDSGRHGNGGYGAGGSGGGGYNNNMRGGNGNYMSRGGGGSNNRNDRAKPYSRYNNDGNNFNRNRGNNGGYNNYNDGGGYGGGPRPLMNSRGNGGRSGYNQNNFTNHDNDNNYNDGGYDDYNNGYNDNNDYNENCYNDNYNSIDDYNNTAHGIKIRGLPFQASERDIREFFGPLKPSNIIITRGRDGRPTGEGEVDFLTHEDAVKGMEKDKKYMGKRYLELFLLSEPGNDQRLQPGAVTPPETLSLGSLMNKNFNSVSQPPSGSIYTNFDSYSTAKPVPPPLGMGNQPPLPTIPSAAAADTSSTYSTNINELLMAEMAQKMFQSAYSHFQATHQTQQQQQGHQASSSYQQQQQAPQRRY